MNLNNYIGLEFEDNGRGPKYDCWGLCKIILEQEFGYKLPDLSTEYLNAHDRFNIPILVKQEQANWKKVKNPSSGNVVLFNLGGNPLHVGVVIDQENMIHIAKGINACIEKFTNKKWINRIEGFYAYN